MAKLLPDLLRLEGWKLEATLKPKLDWNKDLIEAYYTVRWDRGLKAPKRRDKDEGSEEIAPRTRCSSGSRSRLQSGACLERWNCCHSAVRSSCRT